MSQGKWETFERLATIYSLMFIFGEKVPITIRKIAMSPPNPKGDADAEVQLNENDTYFLQMKSKKNPRQVTLNNPDLKDAMQQLFGKFCSFYPPSDTVNRRYVAVMEGTASQELIGLNPNNTQRPYWILNNLEQIHRDALIPLLPDPHRNNQEEYLRNFFLSFDVLCLPELSHLIVAVKERLKENYAKIMLKLFEPPHLLQEEEDLGQILKQDLKKPMKQENQSTQTINMNLSITKSDAPKGSGTEENKPRKMNYKAIGRIAIFIILISPIFFITTQLQISGMNLHLIGWVSAEILWSTYSIYIAFRLSKNPRKTGKILLLIFLPLLPIFFLLPGTILPDEFILNVGRWLTIIWVIYGIVFIGKPLTPRVKEKWAEARVERALRKKKQAELQYKHDHPWRYGARQVGRGIQKFFELVLE